MKELLKNDVVRFAKEFASQNKLEGFWREPLSCFTDVNSPYVRMLREKVNPEHAMAEAFLADAKNIFVFFIPYTKEVINSNSYSNQGFASEQWADGYKYTDELLDKLTAYMVQKICDMGYKAVIPSGIGMDEEKLMSIWSHRHIAYAGGLGTFGINNMLITESGCCGRYSSIVTNLPVEPDEMLKEEYCIYKRNGKCKKCVDNCPAKALTLEGFDRFKCYGQCMKNIEVYGVDVCGKCASGVPCSINAPVAIKK